MSTQPDFTTDVLKPLIGQSAAWQRQMAVSLADIITDLLNEHEPLLKATRDGTEITVSEKGGPLVFTVTVERSETLG
jgi:hypothetical protein